MLDPSPGGLARRWFIALAPAQALLTNRTYDVNESSPGSPKGSARVE
jgi:hypothetical protein